MEFIIITTDNFTNTIYNPPFWTNVNISVKSYGRSKNI